MNRRFDKWNRALGPSPAEQDPTIARAAGNQPALPGVRGLERARTLAACSPFWPS